MLFSKCINNVKFSWLWPRIWFFSYESVLLHVIVLFVLYNFNYKVVVNADINSYYQKIGNKIIIIIIIIIIIVVVITMIITPKIIKAITLGL